MRLLALAFLLLTAACQTTAPSEPVPAAEAPRVPQLASPEAPWLDCEQDQDCASREGTVCHREVMGGTCAPRCPDDARCEGVDPALRCVEGYCRRAVGDAPSQ